MDVATEIYDGTVNPAREEFEKIKKFAKENYDKTRDSALNVYKTALKEAWDSEERK